MSIVKLDLYFLCLSFCLYSLQPLPHIIQNVHKCVRKNHQIKQIHTDSIHYLPCFKLAKWNMLPRYKSTSVLLYSVTSTWSPLIMLNYYYPSFVSGKLTHLVVIYYLIIKAKEILVGPFFIAPNLPRNYKPATGKWKNDSFASFVLLRRTTWAWPN
jgi:hypothetical protein